jgi:hypothetical protein
MVNPVPLLPGYLVFDSGTGLISDQRTIRQADPDVVQYDNTTVPAEIMTDLIYTAVGGIEFSNVARHDTVDGKDVSYSLVKNLSLLDEIYDPSKVLTLSRTIVEGQPRYSISLADKIIDEELMFTMDENGNLIITLQNLSEEEYVEVEIASSGKVQDLL